MRVPSPAASTTVRLDRAVILVLGVLTQKHPTNSGTFVMPGLVPGIHVFVPSSEKNVDGRDKPGNDESITAFWPSLIVFPRRSNQFAALKTSGLK